MNGININFGYKKSEFGNYDVPNGAVIHEEEHDEDGSGGRQDGRGDHQLREAQVQHADRRADRGRGQDDRRNGLRRELRRRDGDQGP